MAPVPRPSRPGLLTWLSGHQRQHNFITCAKMAEKLAFLDTMLRRLFGHLGLNVSFPQFLRLSRVLTGLRASGTALSRSNSSPAASRVAVAYRHSHLGRDPRSAGSLSWAHRLGLLSNKKKHRPECVR